MFLMPILLTEAGVGDEREHFVSEAFASALAFGVLEIPHLTKGMEAKTGVTAT